MSRDLLPVTGYTAPGPLEPVRLTVPLCWHVSAHADICADTYRCRHVPTCIEICRHSECLRNQSLRPYSGADIWDALACVNTGKHADMCRHVPTCDINLDTSYSDHLDVIQMLTCVSTGGNADMSWYVPTCANMLNHSPHLWYQPFEPYLACWHVSAHLDMPTCADMCRHVLTCADMCQHVTLFLTQSYSDHLDLI